MLDLRSPRGNDRVVGVIDAVDGPEVVALEFRAGCYGGPGDRNLALEGEGRSLAGWTAQRGEVVRDGGEEPARRYTLDIVRAGPPGRVAHPVIVTGIEVDEIRAVLLEALLGNSHGIVVHEMRVEGTGTDGSDILRLAADGIETVFPLEARGTCGLPATSHHLPIRQRAVFDVDPSPLVGEPLFSFVGEQPYRIRGQEQADDDNNDDGTVIVHVRGLR